MNLRQLLIFCTLIMFSCVFSQNPNFHIYLCFGQSNMEGSASIEEQDKSVDARFLVLQSIDCDNLDHKAGIWRTATPPLSQCYVGLSPADYFGRTMVENLSKDVKVGVINVAIGGCDIRLFDKDNYQDYDSTYAEDWFLDKVKNYNGNPYEHLIALAKQAQKDGVIKGILLHQGESNEGDEKWPKYVKVVYENMLNDLGLEAIEVPLLAGEVVHKDQNGKCASMNTIIDQLPTHIPTAHVISSRGCSVRADNVHFDSEGVRELGKRYAETMLSLE